MFDPSATLADIDWLRSRWDGPIVVKGVQRVDDAKDLVSAGVDGLAVSNHGGRQLDRAATPLRLLPAVVDAIGDSTEVYLDGGVRCGADVAAAVGLGARACFVARPYLYALMAAGEPGVDHLLGCCGPTTPAPCSSSACGDRPARHRPGAAAAVLRRGRSCPGRSTDLSEWQVLAAVERRRRRADVLEAAAGVEPLQVAGGSGKEQRRRAEAVAEPGTPGAACCRCVRPRRTAAAR